MDRAAFVDWCASKGYSDPMRVDAPAGPQYLRKNHTRYVVKGNTVTKQTRQSDFSTFVTAWTAPVTSLSVTADGKLARESQA